MTLIAVAIRAMWTAEHLRLPLRHLLLLLIICLAWGGNFLTSALALRELPPLLFSALRLMLVGALLLPFLHRPGQGQWPRLFAVSMCNGALHFGLSFWALKLAGNLASPAILMQSYVPMASVLAVIFLRERFGWRTTLGIVVSFLGVLVLGFDPLVLQAPESMVLMLVSAALLAVGTVLMRGLTGFHPIALQGWSALLGILPLLLLSALLESGQWSALQEAGVVAWSGVIYAALIASVLGHGLFYWLIQRYPVSTLTPYLLLTPLFAIVLGIVFYGDRPGARLLLGGALVLGGVLAIALRARTRARPLPEPVEP
jgi:O-acetylserine/cysteine efflux transporter